MNIIKIIKTKLNNFKDRFLKPFWFSHKCNYVKVPYVYGFIIMFLFIASIIIFLGLTISKQYSSGTLAAVSSVIGILAGLYFGTLRLYNNGLELKAKQSASSSPPEDTPSSNTISNVLNTVTKKMGRPKKDSYSQEDD